MPACVRNFCLSDAHFFGAKTTYGTVGYLQVPLNYLKKKNNFNLCALEQPSRPRIGPPQLRTRRTRRRDCYPLAFRP